MADKKDDKKEEKEEKDPKKDAKKDAGKDDEAAEGGEEGAEGEAEGGKKSKKKLFIIVGAAVGVLAIGGVAAMLLLGGGDKKPAPEGDGEHTAEVADEHAAADDGHGESKEAVGDHGEAGKAPAKSAQFVDLPDMLVNLTTDSKRSTFLKLSLSVEVASPSDIKRIEAMTPKIVDSFQLYLRSLRVEDLQGTAGLYRMREELIRRITTVAEPVKVKNILFKEMLIQ